MADGITVSGTADPYTQQVYSAGSNEKNTLTVTSFIKLLAAQLANQDMTNPMSNSEMMGQMTQMAMVQSMGAMTDSITTSTAVTSQTYAAGLVGQELTVAVTEEGPNGLPVPVNVKYGTVVSVNLTGGVPMIKLEGDDEEYPLSYVLGIGRIDNPYAEEGKDKEEEDKGGESEEITEEGKTGNPLLDENLYV
ncbi:flagellar hook capping protein [Enterocloster sp. OA13]|uniref:flagellar hook assembly protein FlgD n=1 Tax=Enterocloster sp. OA13 TaxID=2914161 RepID=UPI00046F0114|nr:flagellar hook capping protein [Enterocloster sp. OA13]